MNWTEKLHETKSQLRRLNKAIPEATGAFGTLGKAVKDHGSLDFKQKELIALGIAIALRCDACIVLHMQAVIRAGATRDEVGDVLAMTVQMGGGPALMYAAEAIECFDELTAENSLKHV